MTYLCQVVRLTGLFVVIGRNGHGETQEKMKFLTLRQRSAIISDTKLLGFSVSKTVTVYGVHVRTIQRLLRNKDDIQEQYLSSHFTGKRKVGLSS